MKFIKTIWGTSGRRLNCNQAIELVLKAPFPYPFTCYTYGKENHKQLVDLGIDSILLCDEDRMFPETSEFGHKVYVWKEAAKTCDKFIFSDFDVLLTRPLHKYFSREFDTYEFAASLRQYVNPKATWRKEHVRKIPCAAWIFMRKNVANELWRIWDEDLKRCWREEKALAKFTEVNGELDLEYYKEYFDSYPWFNLKNESLFKNEDPLFKHYNRQEIPRFLKRLAKNKK